MINHLRPGALWRWRNDSESDPDFRIAHVITDESGSWVVFQPVYTEGHVGRPDLLTATYFLKQYTPKNTDPEG